MGRRTRSISASETETQEKGIHLLAAQRSDSEGEIKKAVELKIPITVFDRDAYIEVRRLTTQCGGDKKLVAFSDRHETLAASPPIPSSEGTVI